MCEFISKNPIMTLIWSSWRLPQLIRNKPRETACELHSYRIFMKLITRPISKFRDIKHINVEFLVVLFGKTHDQGSGWKNQSNLRYTEKLAKRYNDGQWSEPLICRNRLGGRRSILHWALNQPVGATWTASATGRVRHSGSLHCPSL